MSIFCVVGLKTHGTGTPTSSTDSLSARDLRKYPWEWMPNHATWDFSMFSKNRISPMVVHFLPHDATEGKMDVASSVSLPGAIPGCVSAPHGG